MTGLQRQGRLLGSKLRTLRKRNGLTLDELSARCVQLDAAQAPSVSYLSMVETGKRTPSPGTLSLIARVFGKEPQWFLDGHPEPAAQAVDRKLAPAAPALEPAFLFSQSSLRNVLPELLVQTGTSGRQFAQLLIRVWQETHQNDFPDIERAAEAAGGRAMPLDLATLIRICERNALRIRWIEDDRRRLDRGLLRARFEAPGTLLASRRLLAREERLKYELAFFLGHRVLHGGDGAISPLTSDSAHPADAAAAAESPALAARDALHAWREFECSFFAGALLLPRAPFRELLVREAHRVDVHRKVRVGPAVAMRRMTAVSPYRHWHFFDAYPPGYLRTVYRGNRIPLPWGNLSMVPDPCPNWAVFRMLRHYAQQASVPEPTSQISVMLDGGRPRLFCCHSLMTRDAADAMRVLSVGVDLAPALDAQGIAADEISQSVWESCQKSGGTGAIPEAVANSLRAVAHVLRIAWVGDALAVPASIICPRSRACPRRGPCN